jgi:hypothetical protein
MMEIKTSIDAVPVKQADGSMMYRGIGTINKDRYQTPLYNDERVARAAIALLIKEKRDALEASER